MRVGIIKLVGPHLPKMADVVVDQAAAALQSAFADAQRALEVVKEEARQVREMQAEVERERSELRAEKDALANDRCALNARVVGSEWCRFRLYRGSLAHVGVCPLLGRSRMCQVHAAHTVTRAAFTPARFPLNACPSSPFSPPGPSGSPRRPSLRTRTPRPRT